MSVAPKRPAKGRSVVVAAFTAAAALCLWLGPSAAQAADIAVKARPGSGLEPAMLRLSGPLRRGDAETMRETLARLKTMSPPPDEKPLATVELSSLGGDLDEGLRLGRLFRDYRVATVVRRQDICLSACALAFLGGTSHREDGERSVDQRLEIGGKLGFHTFYLNADSGRAPTAGDPAQSRRQGFSEARAATASLVRYAADLGIDPRFVANMMARPQAELTYVNTVGDFLLLKVCPIGLAPPPTSLVEQALNVCNHATGWSDPATPADVRALAPPQARRTILETIQQNMLSLRVRGALSDQLASYSVMRVERAIDALYADLRAAGVRLPEIVGPVFEVSGYRSGGSEMQCFVSLSPDDPDKYAVAIRRPTKWSHPARTAPEECRGLFRHDRDAEINKRPAQSSSSPVLR